MLVDKMSMDLQAKIIWAAGSKTVDQAVQCNIKVKLIHKPMFKTN